MGLTGYLAFAKRTFKRKKKQRITFKKLFSKTELNIGGEYCIIIISMDFQDAFDTLMWITTIQELQDLYLEIPYTSENTVR